MARETPLPNDLLAVIAKINNPQDLECFLEDLLTPNELKAISERWRLVWLLADGKTQREVRDELGVAIATVSRGSQQLQRGTGGFKLAFEILKKLNLPSPNNNSDEEV